MSKLDDFLNKAKGKMNKIKVFPSGKEYQKMPENRKRKIEEKIVMGALIFGVATLTPLVIEERQKNIKNEEKNKIEIKTEEKKEEVKNAIFIDKLKQTKQR